MFRLRGVISEQPFIGTPVAEQRSTILYMLMEGCKLRVDFHRSTHIVPGKAKRPLLIAEQRP